MKFVDKLLSLISEGFNFILNALFRFIEFLSKPLSYLLEFLKGIFYFFYKFFEIAVEIIMIFVALFQFVFALIAGVLRTAKMWLTISPTSEDVVFRSSSYEGFAVVIELLQPTGLMTIVPMVAVAFLWFFAVIKIIGLFGGSIMISPFGRGN